MDLVGVQAASESGGRGVDHLVSDAAGLAKNGTETQTGEDVDVVTLVGVVGDGTVLALDGNGVEGRAGGEEDGALGPLDGLLKGALSLGERVAEGEEDGSSTDTTRLDGLLEGADNRLGEDTKGGSETDQSAGLDVLNDLLESAELHAVVVSAGKVLLVLGKTVATVLGNKTLGIDKPELVTGLLLAQATSSVVLNELLSDTDTSRASTHEDEALVLERNTRQIHGTDVTGSC